MAASQKEHWRDHQAHIHSISLAGELNARVSKWLLIQCWYVAFFNFHHSFQACHSSSRVVVTFDPSKFTEKKQRRFHISNVQYFQPLVALHNQSSPVGGRYKLYYNLTTLLRSLHPPDTASILYYCTSPEKPRIAGELRLRVASSDHATFECGSDLLKLNGQPWSCSLYIVSKYYTPLYEKLREDGFISDDLDAILSTLPKVQKSHPIYTLNDTFIIGFSYSSSFFTVITEQGIESLHFSQDDPVKCVIPLYDDYILPPKEGELHRRCYKPNEISNPPAWSANIDKSATLRDLQLL